ncbi:MAG TPA: aldehyde dehydrogenase family protein [Casimicrobiaceae bacterium]|nr:aldehyde dehydrogenase family protein [Casimicrobiaceae bacterium]
MSEPPDRARPPVEADELIRRFDALRAAQAREPWPRAEVRRDRLARVLAIVRDREAEFVAAIDRDFGHRSAHETRLAELHIVAASARHAMRQLRRWMAPRRVRTPLELKPGWAYVVPQPLGVAGIVSPWNYPVQLALAPAVAALAAGNRVMLKPSEVTPATSSLLAEAIAARFASDEFTVVTGGAELGAAFARLPFDHLFFTGSTAVGRLVAKAAAENLTPVTLELGGKSPAIIVAGADPARLALRLAVGKLLNAGQTCIAPDYALVPAGDVDAWVRALVDAVGTLYPDPMRGDDYTSIVDARHYERLVGLVDDARAHGARIVTIPAGAAPDAVTRRIPPTLVVGATDAMRIMHEEIFGPLLPIEAYTTLDQAIANVARRPRPLALYVFGADQAARARLLRETIAGGVTVDDTLWHFAHEELPFGGVGASGSGAYHGEAGFFTFSHRKSVFVQPRFAATKLLYPPYGRTFEKVLALLKRL